MVVGKFLQSRILRAKEINPTGSDLLYEVEGILKFWQNQFAESKRLLNQIRITAPIHSVFIAAAEYHLGEANSAKQRIQKIENDFGISVNRVFSGESYTNDEMKAKIAPLFPIKQVA